MQFLAAQKKKKNKELEVLFIHINPKRSLWEKLCCFHGNSIVTVAFPLFTKLLFSNDLGKKINHTICTYLM